MYSQVFMVSVSAVGRLIFYAVWRGNVDESAIFKELTTFFSAQKSVLFQASFLILDSQASPSFSFTILPNYISSSTLNPLSRSHYYFSRSSAGIVSEHGVWDCGRIMGFYFNSSLLFSACHFKIRTSRDAFLYPLLVVLGLFYLWSPNHGSS